MDREHRKYRLLLVLIMKAGRSCRVRLDHSPTLQMGNLAEKEEGSHPRHPGD